MKNSVYELIVRKRQRLLDRKIFALQDSDVWQFINLDVALMMRERETYRMILKEALNEIEGLGLVSHIPGLVRDVLEMEEIDKLR